MLLPAFARFLLGLTRVFVQRVGSCSGCCLSRAGVSADPVRCLWQQNHLKAFELQPYSHSPEDLNEDEVVTLHVWFISTFAAV